MAGYGWRYGCSDYLALRRTQKTTRTRKPDWQPWVLFFLRALQKQKQRLEIKVDREKKILGQLPELSLRIFELAKDRGQIKVEDVLRVTGASHDRYALSIRLIRSISLIHVETLDCYGRLRLETSIKRSEKRGRDEG
jgi:hypothetical protein